MSTHQKINALRAALFISVLLMGVKFYTYWVTRSNAILTDALESIINVTAGAFALFSTHFSALPKDKNHPYGHGKIEFLSAGFEGGLIFIAGIAMITKAAYGFFTPPEIRQVDTGVYLSAFSAASNLAMGLFLVNRGKKFDSIVLIADGKHLISDTFSSVGLIAGLLVIWMTGMLWLDNVIAIVFGLLILWTGFRLVKEAVTNLLDEADYSKLHLVIETLEKNKNEKWIDMHNLRVIKYGSRLHVDCHITLPWYLTLNDSHHEVSKVEETLKNHIGEELEFFIHTDPCVPPGSCRICCVKNCRERKSEHVKTLKWTLENSLPDKKHGV